MIEWIISATVLLAVLLLLRLCLKGRIGLRLQYALWLLAAVRLLVPFSLGTSRLSVMNPVEHSDFYRAAVATEATTAPNSSAPTVVEPDVPPILPSTGTAPAAPVRPIEPITPVTPVTPVFPADPQPEPEESLWVRLGRIAKIVWMVGGAGMLLALAAVNLHLAARLKRSRTPLQTDSSLPVWQSNAVQTPCLFGLWRPTIYVTAETAADETVLHHCLRHEETHYRHGDHLWAVVRALCLAIHWYNPLVWLAAFCSKTDAELACDESTIRTLGESERAAYGRTLLTLTAAARPPVLAVATTMTDGKRIKERIKLIVRKPKTAVLTLIAVIVIAAVAVGCTYTGAGGEETSSDDDDPALTATASVLTTATTPPTSDQPPATTTVPQTPDYLYYDVSVVPGVYRLYAQTAADSDEAVYEAAEVLVGEMLDAMKQSDPSRSFMLTEYKDVELRLHHSSEVLDRSQDWGIAADSALVNDDVWLIYVDAAFRFEGLYGAIGKPIDDRWWTALHQGSAAPMILLKTEDSYLLWWANAYAEGYPKEVSAHLFDENVTELLPVDPNWTPSAALKHTLEHGGDTPVVLFFGENQARAAEIAYDEQVGTLLERYSWTAIERPASDPAGIRIEVLTRDGMEAFVIYDTVPTIIRHVDLNNLERPLTYWQQRGAGVPIALMLRYALFGEVGERTPESALEEMARASDVSYVTLRAGAESSPALIAEKADGTILYYLQQYSWTEGGDRPVDEAAYYLTITSGDGRRSLTMWDETDKSYLHYTDGIISRSWMAAPRDEYRQFAADIRETVYDPLVSGVTNTQQNGPLTEESARAFLAARDAAAELIALYPAGSVDYLLYCLSDGRVRVDAYSGQTGEPIETDILTNRGYGDRVICAYDAVDAEVSYWYTLSLYVSEIVDGELLYPEVLRLQERDGAIVLSVSNAERETLPLGFHTVALGHAWATPELRECRVGLDGVSLALAAPGDVNIEGNECFPWTAFAYDAEKHTLTVTMKNTILLPDLQVPQESNPLVANVELRAIANGVELCIVLREGAFSYVPNLRTVFSGAGADGNLGIIEISILQGGSTTVKSIAY
ncbi:MAG: hypothetical protein IJC93_08815 [Clostridia bacterium]|nr:hypothetical protein [Clostridia bacterium]